MDISLKRIIAFVIDIFLLTCLLTLFIKVTNVDPYYEEYRNTNNTYLEEVKKSDNKDYLMALNYDLYKYKVVSSSLSIGCLILYFGIFQFVNKGQTIGKKIMKIKIVSNNQKKLNIGNYLIRTVILTNIVFTLLNTILVYFLSVNSFYYVVYVCSLLSSLVYIINIFMITLRKDNRGLHDILANTKVVVC